MKSIDLCVFYITTRNFQVKLEDNPELRVCYQCPGFDVNCSKQLVVKVDRLEYKLLQGVEKNV
jgi:hypothetical protein